MKYNYTFSRGGVTNGDTPTINYNKNILLYIKYISLSISLYIHLSTYLSVNPSIYLSYIFTYHHSSLLDICIISYNRHS